jgi:iron complex transport system substrate-binding protein
LTFTKDTIFNLDELTVLMSIDRIVSFFPSATELLYELDVGDKVYGVTHECLYPEDAKSKPRIISSVFDPSIMSSREIDDKIVELTREGKEIYKLDEEKLKHAKPDLIISQDTCEVCSAYTSHVSKALNVLDNKPEIYPLNPHDINGILDSIKGVSEKIGAIEKGNEIIQSLKKRIDLIQSKNFQSKPRILALEWLDPFFTSGHWVPEMVEIAGGKNLISSKGEQSRRMEFEEIEQCDPDIIVLMPCGFDTSRTILEYKKILQNNAKWNSLRAVKDQNVFAVDANSYFSKPSLRTITGIEILAKIIHPDIFENEKSLESFKQIKS